VLDVAPGATFYVHGMTMTEEETHTCGCGCSAMTDVTEAKEPCGCGCECCGDGQPKTREQEIAELLTLRQAVSRRLTELGNK
jgi:hypothetical protein